MFLKGDILYTSVTKKRMKCKQFGMNCESKKQQQDLVFILSGITFVEKTRSPYSADIVIIRQ